METDKLRAAKIIVDPRIRCLIPPLTEEEASNLQRSILEEGCRDALVLWGDILLDGHNRLSICTKHGIPFRTIQKSLPDLHAAINWVIDNQLSRRNLTPEHKNYLIGKKYNEEKRDAPSAAQSARYQKDTKSGKRTRDAVAKRCKVAPATVARAAKYHDAIETITQACGEDIKQQILAREIPITQHAAIELAKEEPHKIRSTLFALRKEGAKKRPPVKKTSKRITIPKDIDPATIIKLDAVLMAIRELPASPEAQHGTMVSILPMLERKYQLVADAINSQGYAHRLEELTLHAQEAEDELASLRQDILSVRREKEELSLQLRSRAEKCSMNCDYTFERLALEFRKRVSYFTSRIEQNDLLSRYITSLLARSKSADSKYAGVLGGILAQQSLDAAFTVLSTLEELEEHKKLTDKIAAMYGYFKQVLTTAGVELDDLNIRISRLDAAFDSLGLQKGVLRGEKKPLKGRLDEKMKGRLALLHKKTPRGQATLCRKTNSIGDSTTRRAQSCQV